MTSRAGTVAFVVGKDDPVRADRVGAGADADDGGELLGDGVLPGEPPPLWPR